MELVLILLAIFAAPFAAGWLYQTIGSVRDARRLPPPGRMVRGLHIHQQGSGDPAVILESGIAGSSISWKHVEDQVSRFARVVSYDRAGLGWSASASSLRTLERMVAELRGLLAAAGLTPPYILVGHSFGGLIVRYFAARYPGEVAGLLLVDPVPVSDWFPIAGSQRERLARGVKLSRRGAWLARFGVVRFALASLLSGSRVLPRAVAKFTAGNGASVMDGLMREVRKLPQDVWPAVQAHWCQPKCFIAMADYLEALPANAEAAAPLEVPAGCPAIGLFSDYKNAAPLAGLDYRYVEDCGHWIQLDRPELVAEAIRDLLALSRQLSRADPE